MDDEYAIKTYRYLRIAMIAVIVMLLIAVVVEQVNTRSGCWQGSLSAYYYTPVQSIFVGALITIGVCMIALRGTTDRDDVLMNLGGMLAPVVALVPTPNPGGCRSVGVAVAAAPENIQNNMIALFFAGAIALVVAVTTLLRKPDTGQTVGMIVAAAIFFGGVGWFVFGRENFDDNAHYTAAILLFVCIVLMAILNSRREGWSLRYLTVAVLMVVSAVVIVWVTLAADWQHGILVVEVVLIVLFAVFWAIQTNEYWDDLPESAAQPSETEQTEQTEQAATVQ